MTDNVFSEKELEIFNAWLHSKKNREIAEKFGVSEAYISQTLTKVQNKFGKLENSISLLQQLGIIHQSNPLKLTDKGKQSLQQRSPKINKKKENMLKETNRFLVTPQVGIKTISPLMSKMYPDSIKAINPSYSSPHEMLKYTIKQVIQFVLNPEPSETIDDVSLRLGLSKEIIDAARWEAIKIQEELKLVSGRRIRQGVGLLGMSDLAMAFATPASAGSSWYTVQVPMSTKNIRIEHGSVIDAYRKTLVDEQEIYEKAEGISLFIQHQGLDVISSGKFRIDEEDDTLGT